MKPSTPHDLLFKQFLHDPETARDFLRFHLPDRLQALCDLNSLKVTSGSFVEPDLQGHCCDVLYALQAAGRPGYVYALIEHQSTPDRWMAFRLLRYCIAAMQQHLAQHRQGRRRRARQPHHLPLVIPMLFYHGQRSPYPFSTRWLDLFAEPEVAAALYQQPFPLIDVTVIDDDEIRQHRRIAVLELVQKHIRQRDALLLAREIGQLIRQGLHTKDQLQSLLHYFLGFGESAQTEEIVETLVHQAPQQEEEIVTIADYLRQEGMKQGLEQGRQEGRQEGVLESRLEMAKDLLRVGIDPQIIMAVTRLSAERLRQCQQQR